MTEPSEPPSSGTTPAPFLGALAIIIAVVITIWLFNVFSGDGLTEEQRVGQAVVGQNDALQRQDYADFRSFTCAEQQGTEAEVLAGQRDSSTKRGERVVEGATDVAIDGDRATADVTYHFNKDAAARETVEITFARQDGAWKVCSTGPS